MSSDLSAVGPTAECPESPDSTQVEWPLCGILSFISEQQRRIALFKKRHDLKRRRLEVDAEIEKVTLTLRLYVLEDEKLYSII